MKTSCNWLKDYVEFSWFPAELAGKLTMAGLEVEGIETVGDLPETVVVAKILAREKHPNADRLSLCQVDDGSGETLRVVCGAPNCDAGKKAAFARVGTKLGESGEFTVKKTKLRGEDSCGMLCSEQELGLSDAHQGIMLLADDAPVGMALGDYLGADTVIDWEVTPNRPDWLSHIGIARELAALTGAELKLPDVTLAEAGGDINDHITIEAPAPDLCPRYTARFIRNVKIGPSPKWLQDRLLSIGLRPINNVVDITNFVLMECGQPLHAFDCDKLAGAKIIVRRADAGETISTLDGEEHELTTGQLLIADAEGGVALAGVMGGGNSEISEATTNVLLESAAFHPPNIRATSKKLGISTDSSYRFERGVDFNMVEFASARAAHLICELAGGELVSGMIDLKTGPYKAPEITCRYARVNSLIGLEVPPAMVKRILTRLGLEIVRDDHDSCATAVPSWRPDLSREADLIEEIARLHGYDKIPAAKPEGIVGGGIENDDYYPQQELCEQLLGLGLDECAQVSAISEAEALKHKRWHPEELVRIQNPLSQEYAVMRPDLLGGMLNTVARNIARDNHDLRLFELGRVFCHKKGLPEERLECAVVLTGRKHPERFAAERDAVYDFYDLSGLVQDWFAAARLPEPRLAGAAHPGFAKDLCTELLLDEKVVAVLGRIDQALTQDMRIRHPLFMALVQVDPLLVLAGKAPRYRELSQFPAVTRDVAFVTAEALEHRRVLDVIASCRVEILEDAQLFDIFRDEQALGTGRKSMAYTLTFRAPDRTLTDQEVNQAHDTIKARLTKELTIEIR